MEGNYLVIKCGYRLWKGNFRDVIYLENQLKRKSGYSSG